MSESITAPEPQDTNEANEPVSPAGPRFRRYRGTGTHPCLCRLFEVVDPESNEVIENTGCDLTTSRQFAPGHDAKLKSLLIRAGAEDLRIREVGGTRLWRAGTIATQFGFRAQVDAGIKVRKSGIGGK